MKSLPALLASVALGCVLSGEARAQVTAGRAVIVPASSIYSLPAPYGGYNGYVRSWPYPYYYHHHHAATAAESYLRGVAAVTRAQGEYNLMSAQASVFDEEARSMSLDNHKKGVETYYAARKINQQSRAAERGPRPTSEDLIRLAKTAAPDRPGADQLNPATGQIAWPAALQGEEFASQRAEIDDFFALRAAASVGAEQLGCLEQATGAMLTLLRNQIRELPPMEYTAARRFIESLAYEAHLPTA